MKRLIIIASFYFPLYVAGQDLHFSQFNEQPSLVNPALTGAVTKLRCSAVHKQQWNSMTTPFTTMGASFEIRSPGRLKRTGKFGRAKKRTPGLIALGISGYKDNAGMGKMTSLSGNLSVATFIPAGKRNFFSMGLQASLVQKKLNTSGLVYPDQFTGSGYDPVLIPGEEFPGNAFQYADYAAGILWSYGNDIKNFLYHHETRIRLGFSAYHLTRPTQQYFNSSADYLYHKFVIHGELLRDLPGTHFAIVPAFIVQLQGISREIVAGGIFKFYNSNDTKFTGFVRRSSFGIGLNYRHMDAMIVSFHAELEEQYAIGLSYDLTVSTLKNYSGKRGGLEVTLKYTPANPFLYQNKK